MSVNLGIFAINLQRSPERWQRVVEQFSDKPWPLHRVAAVDGRDCEATLAYRGFTRDDPNGVGWSVTRLKMISYVEEACFCSHLEALKCFIRSEHSHALILEDDARIIGDLAPVISAIGDVCRGDTILKISGSPRRGARLVLKVRDCGSSTIVSSFEPASNATAYIITKAVASRLIERAGRMLAPFDDYLSAPGFHGCAVLHVSPWVITNRWPKKDVPSTLAEGRFAMTRKRGAASWIRQRMVRARLRLALWRSALRVGGSPMFAAWSP